MVCNRVSFRSFAQTIFFSGYMIGSLIFGVLSDKYVYIIVLKINNFVFKKKDLVDDLLWVFRFSSSVWLAFYVHLHRRKNLVLR